MKALLARLAAHTEPRRGVEARLRTRLNPPSAGPALRALGEVDRGLVARLQAGRRARQARPRARLTPIALGALALLAGSLTFGDFEAPEAGTLDVAAPPALPGADPPEADVPARVSEAPAPSPVAGAPAPVAVPRSHPAAGDARGEAPARPTRAARRALAPTSPSPGPDLALAPASDPSPGPAPTPAPDFSSLRLSAGRPRLDGGLAIVDWEVGTLVASLDTPGRSRLRLRTREGEVELDAASVELHRDRLGTRVRVLRGEVEQRCLGAVAEAPEGRTCLPTRGAGWLGRAEALRERGAGPEALAAADAGLALGEADPAFGELVALRVALLQAAGRADEARATAALYPPDGPRAALMRRLARR